jgi:hypothetical protein
MVYFIHILSIYFWDFLFPWQLAAASVAEKAAMRNAQVNSLIWFAAGRIMRFNSSSWIIYLGFLVFV